VTSTCVEMHICVDRSALTRVSIMSAALHFSLPARMCQYRTQHAADTTAQATEYNVAVSQLQSVSCGRPARLGRWVRDSWGEGTAVIGLHEDMYTSGLRCGADRLLH
jgi:hypothetical protein